MTEFNRAIIGSTADLVCAYKPNLGFYMAYGLAGMEALLRTRELIPADIPVILDAKVNDIAQHRDGLRDRLFRPVRLRCRHLQPLPRHR